MSVNWRGLYNRKRIFTHLIFCQVIYCSSPEALSKKLEAHAGDPSNIFEIICDNYDKNGINKLSNICKELKGCTLKNTMVEPYD